MAKLFDPRTALKQLAKPLLREFFARRGDLQDLPWDELKDLGDVEPIYNAWQQLPDDERRQVQVIFRDLVQLADHRGIRAFAAEIQSRAPHRAFEFQACRSGLNKALWFYLNFPEAFTQASLFARADALSTGRYAVRCNGLPKASLEVTPEIILRLQQSLGEHYWPKEMRGEQCRVSHYSRPGGTEYFFAYLEDWPDMPLIFNDAGELIPKLERYTFSVVYACCPQEGSLELLAKGGWNVQHELLRRFSHAAYGPEIEPGDPVRPAYRLQQVLDPKFTYPTHPEDCIGRVRISRIVLETLGHEPNVQKFELTFKRNVWRADWLRTIHQTLRANGLSEADVVVQEVTFQLFFRPAGWAPQKTLTFSVSLPSWSDLKFKTDEMRLICERCLQLWEMYRD